MSRSRSGCSLIAAVSRSTTSACSPSASRTSASSSIATTRSSSSRATSDRVALEIAGVGQRSAAPQVERLGEPRHRGGRVAVRVALAGQHEQAFEALHVELVGLDPQEVAVRTGGQSSAGRIRVACELEHLAQAADVDAERGRGARRRLAVPELLDQLLRRHRTVRAHGEQHQQLARLGAAQRHGRSVVADLGRTEDSKLHRRPRRVLQPRPTVHPVRGGAASRRFTNRLRHFRTNSQCILPRIVCRSALCRRLRRIRRSRFR